MSRASNITYDQVAAAANAIKAAGDKPTARRVREALGTGSMATVLKYFQRYQGGNTAKQEQDDNQDISLDPAIVKAITTAIAAQVAAAGVESEQKIADLQGEITALIQENERISTDNEALDVEIDALKQRAAKLTGQMETISNETRNLTNQLENERNGRIHAEQAAAVLTAQKIDAENRAQEAIAAKNAYHELLLQSREKTEELSRELTTELRERLTANAGEKTDTTSTNKTKPTRTKTKPETPPTSVR